MKSIVIVLFVFVISSCAKRMTREDLQVFASTETFPDDTFLSSTSNKKALIIVAHDDDDCAMSGTIALLSTKGWEIKQLSLQRHIIEKTGKNPADIICQGNELILEDGKYRKGLDTMKTPYLPIPYSEIDGQFYTNTVAQALIQMVNSFGPSVVFTLDNVKGGYGHPEHIFVSQLVKNLFEEGQINVDKVYQSVYTDHMEEEIVDKWLKAKMEKWGYPHASTIANELYGIKGMPEPTVQVSIVEVAKQKMNYLMAYDEDVRKNLNKFIPYYEEFDAETYFGIFDREFLRVIEKAITE